MKEKNTLLLAKELSLTPEQIAATIKLLDEGNTVPFIARYRKEATHELNEDHIRDIQERINYLRNLDKRRQEILTSINQQEKLTPELELAITKALKLQELEDLYLPYKTKKRTRAQIAREKGLQPLADLLLQQDLSYEALCLQTAPFLDPEQGLDTLEVTWETACDIIAEQISETASLRDFIRRQFWRDSKLTAELNTASDFADDFLNYQDFSKEIRLLPSHQILA